MQEKKATSSDTETQTQQIACKTEKKESSSKTSLEKITSMSKSTQFAFLLLLVFILIVTVIPELMVNFTMSLYNDTTLAGTHTTTSTNLIIAFVTILYVWLTKNLVTTSKESIELSKKSIAQNIRSIELSKEAIVQSQKEQRIRDIEKRLELFYIPTQNILIALNSLIEWEKKEMEESEKKQNYGKPNLNYGKPNANHGSFQRENFEATSKLKELGKFRFLAKDKTCKSFMSYVFHTDAPEDYIKKVESYRKDLTLSINMDVENYMVELSNLKQNK